MFNCDDVLTSSATVPVALDMGIFPATVLDTVASVILPATVLVSDALFIFSVLFPLESATVL